MSEKDVKVRNARRWSISVLILGLAALAVGLTVLIVQKLVNPPINDVEYLITAGEWVRNDYPTVIWDFTETGKGMLTTDGHLNNYEFNWSLEGGKLKIETSWLYDLNDEFTYKLDKGNKSLTIVNEEKNVEVKFTAQNKTEPVPLTTPATTQTNTTTDSE